MNKISTIVSFAVSAVILSGLTGCSSQVESVTEEMLSNEIRSNFNVSAAVSSEANSSETSSDIDGTSVTESISEPNSSTETSSDTNSDTKSEPTESKASPVGMGTHPSAERSPKFEKHPRMYTDEPLGTPEKHSDTVYLTFDDGPSLHTRDILKILRDNDVKATFFVVPDDSEECAKSLRAIAEEGHTIGIHSRTHKYDEIYASADAFLDDFAQAYDIIEKATGKCPEIFRFPAGSRNDYNVGCRAEIIKQMKERGFVYFDWNVDSNDWRGLSVDELINNVTTDAEEFSEAQVLMHDLQVRDNTIQALDPIIKGLKAKGYKFAPLSRKIEPIQQGVNW